MREKGGLEVVLGLCAMDEGNPCKFMDEEGLDPVGRFGKEEKGRGMGGWERGRETREEGEDGKENETRRGRRADSSLSPFSHSLNCRSSRALSVHDEVPTGRERGESRSSEAAAAAGSGRRRRTAGRHAGEVEGRSSSSFGSFFIGLFRPFPIYLISIS